LKCPNCGKEVSDNSNFCEFCGYDLVKYRKTIERGIANISKSDIETAYGKTEEVVKQARKLATKGGPFSAFFNRIKVLISLLKDYRNKEYREVPWRVIAAAVFAILYFINPFDLIPDFIPGVGYIDDIAVIALIFASIEGELKKYAKWKGIELQ